MLQYVTYNSFKIDLHDYTFTFAFIIIVLLLFIVLTSRKKSSSFFDMQATTSLRGIAVLLLVLGHLSIKCLRQPGFLSSGGYWAVVAFLFISGYGLFRKHQFENIDFKFWKTRIIKLYVPLWISLILFISLDHYLINLQHSTSEIILNFLGFHLNGALIRVNSVAWYIEYIMVLYFAYWIVSKFKFNESAKIAILSFLCLSLYVIVILTPISMYHSIWAQYSLVFPLGVIFGKYSMTFIDGIQNKIKYKVTFTLSSFLSIWLLFYWDQLIRNSPLMIFKPLLLIVLIIGFLVLYEKLNLNSGFLTLLGTYSYEIFLLHLPFMVKYDFFLFRQPLYLSFFAYFAFILSSSIIMASTSNYIRAVINYYFKNHVYISR